MPQAAPLSEDDRATVARLAADVERRMTAQLGTAPPPTPPAAPSSSGRSSPATLPPAPPAPAIDVTESLAASVRRVVEARLGRLLAPSDTHHLQDTLEEALSLLQAGSAEQRRELLQTSMGTALASPSGAQLWASALEATSTGPGDSIRAVTAAIIDSVSSVAAALFASAALVPA